MTHKTTMPEPVAYRSKDQSYLFGLSAPTGSSERWDGLVTTDQAEAYAEARVREVQRWQPIETAPKDGTAILLSNERGAWMAKYDPVYPSGYRPENPWFSLMLNHDHMRKGKPYAPTHWMPLPTPPKPTPW